MRLHRVELDKAVAVRGHGLTAVITSEMVPISYDPQTDMVTIGNDGDEVPRSRVIAWKRDRSRTPPQVKAQCPECKREFNDNRALGAHRKQAHGVNGTTRKR
jgi:hypothetical protein